MPHRRLYNRIALVTGGSRGIGAAICRKLSRDGAIVILTYGHDAEQAERVCDELVLSGGKAQAIRCDMEMPDQIDSLFQTISKSYQHLNILVNNAAVAEMIPFEENDIAQFARFFNINVRGPMLAIQKAMPLWENGGSVINISSAIVRECPAHSLLYTSSKAALDAMTQVLAKELGPKKVRVNSLSPGLIDTKLSRDAMPEAMFAKIAKHTPLQRLGTPEDIANAAAFLASDESYWITGEIIAATGGI
ncbi:MAG TPA: glucose 1-dehydrogenase [Gemmatales bacterium]|nr:glucose 1-dehydrogenase [Gemmatales bacterium]HMP16615.1 glucose 1-dehydrogenase [Gemmatales bacterium]